LKARDEAEAPQKGCAGQIRVVDTAQIDAELVAYT
jgi:hypothetical protein